MELKKLNSIIRALNETSASEIRLESKTVKLKMIKSAGKLLPPASLQDIKTTEQVKKDVSILKAKEANKNDIAAKSIGFFSRYDKKEKKQFVKLRDFVNKGDVVGIITSMHVGHDVVAEKSGKIVEFLVEEGQPVEYGQPLIRLDPPVTKRT